MPPESARKLCILCHGSSFDKLHTIIGMTATAAALGMESTTAGAVSVEAGAASGILTTAGAGVRSTAGTVSSSRSK